ncbi:MAG: RNA pyrophosphohydrolase [Alphaproteobacteria bacterium]|jgi:putative (di)nucleoside polyphosphate hydrolase|nr:RNA pyrophosphohydrolase [Alphaproteobacteria bacterium]
MSIAYQDRPYRKGVGIMLLNRDGLIFAGQRIDQVAEAWQMPQGGIDDGEEAREAALRELHEEVGTTKAEMLAESPHWRPYDLPEALADSVWQGRYRGQMQKWFAMRFTGEDADIRVREVETPEFDAWRWLTARQLMDLIVPFKRPIYEEVLAEFRALLD